MCETLWPSKPSNSSPSWRQTESVASADVSSLKIKKNEETAGGVSTRNSLGDHDMANFAVHALCDLKADVMGRFRALQLNLQHVVCACISIVWKDRETRGRWKWISHCKCSQNAPIPEPLMEDALSLSPMLSS